ncbi:MAG: ABC transporter ATP-binding protein [Rhodospirillales bacterium]|nr:ABC transporter ATP-binding protein [Rhodospirillales bacterium]MDP6843673.1 ABC transporter ATP-binding protein [Rhodospirillales bacterium]MDP7642350.1 ABC transporter ATP-binding protein [Alphaproteobacteria bacterium]
MTLLSITDLDVFYGKAQALHGVSLDVTAGEIVAIIGPNGAGKSTLLDSILGLTKRQGSITFDGQDITRMAAAKIVRLGIGYAPERGHLFPFMGVRENLLVGAYRKRDEIDANLAKVFGLFPRLEERQKQESATQSGGERQMLSLGRALMSSPKLLIIDEPTMGLAPRVCQEIAAVIRDLNQQTGLTVVVSEQNVNFAMSLAGQVYLLETGRIREKGTPEDLRQKLDIAETYFGA